MKRKISLKEFIQEVKDDILSAVDDESPIFTMDELELEVSFSLDASAKAGAKFIVEAEGATKSSQSHKVKIKLRPIKKHRDRVVPTPSFG